MNRPDFHYVDRGLAHEVNWLQWWMERAVRWRRVIGHWATSVPSQAPGIGGGVPLADLLFDHYFKSRWELPGFLLQVVLDTYITLDNRIGIIRGQRKENESPEGDAITEQSSELMTVHYDMPVELFENFLGKSMKYSMGLWEQGAANLEEAQEAMLTDLCRKAEIEDGHAILDIGCGFGSFAVHALQAFPKSTVHGLTLSKVQADYIRQKQAEPGHPLNTERFKLIEADFNTVEFEPVYDRVISIGVFDLRMALEKVSKVLKPGGTCFLHYIVFFQPLERMGSGPLRGGPILKHIFPRRLGAVKKMNEPEPHPLEKSELLIQVLAKLQQSEHVPLDVEFAVDVCLPERQLVEGLGQDAVGMEHQAKLGIALSESKGFPGGELDFALGAIGLQRSADESGGSTGLMGRWGGSGFGCKSHGASLFALNRYCAFP